MYSCGGNDRAREPSIFFKSTSHCLCRGVRAGSAGRQAKCVLARSTSASKFCQTGRMRRSLFTIVPRPISRRRNSIIRRHIVPHRKGEACMRRVLFGIGILLLAVNGFAQTADEIIARYIKTVGGIDRINAVTSIKRTGKFTGGGGFEAQILEENARPNLVRQEFALQGMTAVNAYDGTTGWKIDPFEGKKDPESLSEEELKSIIEDSDIDGPLVNYAKKGNKVESLGTETVEGSEAYKIKVTTPAGDVRTYFIDSTSYVPIKIETRRMVRGAERNYETILGDYKEVNGWYLPFSIENGVKGNPNRQKVTYSKIEANVPMTSALFVRPGSGATVAVAQASTAAPAPQAASSTPTPDTRPATPVPVDSET